MEMLGGGKTDETVRARTVRRKALREWHLPLMTVRVSGRCCRHKPGVRSALRVCDRSVSVGNGVDDREVEGTVSRFWPHGFDMTTVRPGAAGKTVRIYCISFSAEKGNREAIRTLVFSNTEKAGMGAPLGLSASADWV